MKRVYFDNNATTPLHPEVTEELRKYLELFGNASSAHAFGREARGIVESARAKLADLIGADPEEIIFTSGGSESNNLVFKGVTCQGTHCRPPNVKIGHHMITSSVEHPSVMNSVKCLETLGFPVTYLPVDSTGLVDPDDVKKAITPNTVLISVMLANNEIGTIEPVKEISKIAREHKIPMHTDAVQAVGKIPVNAHDLGVDFLSLSGHKLNGPKGIGALYIRKGVGICPIIHGGHQERGLRGGTENNIGVIGLGKAAEVAKRDMAKESKIIIALRDKLHKGIEETIFDTRFNGHLKKRLPGTLNISFKYIEGESILFRLDAVGIAVSTGSACSTGSLEPSHVLTAIGLPYEIAHGSIRFSLGYGNTEQDVDYVLEHLPKVIADLREMSPLYKKAKS